MELKSIEAIISALNHVGARYLVVGGLAVNAHGYERFTNDLDLVIGLEKENIINALEALAAIGYNPVVPITPAMFAVSENRSLWRTEKNMLVLKLWSDNHKRTPVDVFVYEPFNFNLEYNKAKIFSIGAQLNMPVLCLETLLTMKADAGREKDFQDIEALKKIEKLI